MSARRNFSIPFVKVSRRGGCAVWGLRHSSKRACTRPNAFGSTSGIWELVPHELLPQGATVAYFNAHAFMEEAHVAHFNAARPEGREMERRAQTSEAEFDAGTTMLREFMDTGAHYDETLRAQFPLFRGAPPPWHPYPEAWTEGAPRSDGNAGLAHGGTAPFSGQGRRLGD